MIFSEKEQNTTILKSQKTMLISIWKQHSIMRNDSNEQILISKKVRQQISFGHLHYIHSSNEIHNSLPNTSLQSKLQFFLSMIRIM